MKTFWRSPFLTLILLAVDAIALSWIWEQAYQIRESFGGFFSNQINPFEAYQKALPFLLILWLIILARCAFYSHHERISSLNDIGPILWSILWMVVCITVYNQILKPDFGRAVVGAFAGLTAIYLFVSRTVFRVLKRRAVERGEGLVRVLVVGAEELGRETLSRIREHPDIGFKMVGFIAANGEKKEGKIEGYPILGDLNDLLPVIQRHGIEEVFLATPGKKEDEIFELVEQMQKKTPVICKVAANMLYVIANRAKVDEIIGLPVIAFRGNILSPAQILVKRLTDMVLGGILALLAAPVAIIFAILIKLDSKGPVLFVHQRVGQNGKLFNLLKFRTMNQQSERYAEAPTDQTDPRVTTFGRFLRRTSFDEIPQLINVLRGEMSLVGPRPEMPFIVANYKPWQSSRLRVKPGLTGLWQVAGRKNLPLYYNLEYDFYYVKNQSLSLDLEIFLRTIPVVLLGKGAY